MGGQGIIPSSALGAPGTMKTKFIYTGIRVRDLEKSVKFYTGVLGMKELGRSTIAAAKGTVVNLVTEEGGPVLELNYYEKGSAFETKYVVGEGLDHLAFEVADLEAALAEAKQAGHPMVQEIKAPKSRWAYIEDPDGNWIELCEAA